MTATRLAKLGTLVMLAAGWVVAGALLWRTTVPGNLRLPHVDPHRYWSDRALHRAAHFDGFLRWDWVAATLVGLVVLLVLVRLGPRIAAAWELGRVGTGVMVGAVATLALWAASLPFGLAALWWGRRYGIEKQSYLSWLLSQWPSLLGQVVGLTIVLTILLLLAGRFERYWWAIAGPLFTGVAFVLVLVIPYVAAIGTRSPHRTKLAAQLRELERREGIAGTPIRIENASDRTTAANAETIGIGPSARVVIWDTLLDGRFSPGEIKVVAAHEFGHVARRHIWKGLGWYGLISLPVLAAVARVSRRWGGLYTPSAVPVALFALVLISVVTQPFGTLLTRRMEFEADWVALETTRDPAAARELFEGFTTAALADPDPPEWAHLFFDTHPSIVERIAEATAWERRNGAP
jgi:STE24 endopeptidase